MSFLDYTPTPTRLVTLKEADDSEPLEAATTNVSLEQLADGIAWLDAEAVASTTLVRPQDTPLINTNTGVVTEPGLAVLGVSEEIQQMLRVPDGATITDITAYIDPTGGSPMPSTRPHVRLRKFNMITGVETFLSAVTDPNSTSLTYQPRHGFGYSGLSEVVNRSTTVYSLHYTGEVGMNAADVICDGCTVTYVTAGPDKAGN